jgi:hypothetical protein
MPLYFLDVVTGDNRLEDPDGGEQESIGLAGLRRFWPSGSWLTDIMRLGFGATASLR